MKKKAETVVDKKVTEGTASLCFLFVSLILLQLGTSSLALAKTIRSSATTLSVRASEFPTGTSNKVYTVSPSSSSDPLEETAALLKPGDILILKGGIYTQSGRRSISAKGDASNYILITAAPGESVVITHSDPTNQNNLELDNAAYLIIRGIKFKGGSSGVRFIGGHHIVLEQNEIYETLNNAIPMNSGNSDSIIIRKNHIHHTGQSANSEGEGVYAGCNNNTCRVTNSLFEGNYIHDLKSDTDGGNDGIELKVGSGGNIVRHNVIHTTTIGRRYPCVFSYGGGAAQNIIESNVLFECGEAIQVVSDTLVRNNVIFNSDQAITAAPHAQVSQMKNVSILNNTFVNNSSGVYVRWSAATNMVFANNAVYSAGQVLDASFGQAVVSKNYLSGGSGFTPDGSRLLNGGTLAETFIDAANLNFWLKPSSLLINQGNTTLMPALDFNGQLRTTPFDVGAYETNGASSNPGWVIKKGFKSY